MSVPVEGETLKKWGSRSKRKVEERTYAMICSVVEWKSGEESEEWKERREARKPLRETSALAF